MNQEGRGSEEHELEFVEVDQIPPEQFRRFRKSGLTRARQLTEDDVRARGGIINTLEGRVSFQPGDYLAIGSTGEEYPIRLVTINKTKEAVGPADIEGWTYFRATNTVRAVQWERPFSLKRVGTEDIFTGKAGDFIIDSGTRQYIIDQEIFKSTYELIPDEGSE